MTLAPLVVVIVSCGGAPTESISDPVSAVSVVNVVGVPDRGLDPSVVALTNAEGQLCSGVLLANNLVLTARHCVVRDLPDKACPAASLASDPSTLHVFTSAPDPSAMWASTGEAIVTPDDADTCGADIALVVLSSPIAGVPASLVSRAGVAEGSYVRTVGFASPDAGNVGELLMREHLPVLDVTRSELAVGEATCVGTGGSVAFDETTGQVVGVLARAGTLCGTAQEFDVFTRADAFYSLVLQALTWAPLVSSGSLVSSTDGGVHGVDAGRVRDAGHTKKPLTDIGAACNAPSECGSGVCVLASGSQYCSQVCSPFDRCPSDFKCVIASAGGSVCVQT